MYRVIQKAILHSFPRIFYLIDFADAVHNFLWRTKLISSFFKEIYITNYLS